MAEIVTEGDHQQLHHMQSESNWDRRGARWQLVVDVNGHVGYASGLLIDESGFDTKGELSAGVVQQWDVRLDETDSCR